MPEALPSFNPIGRVAVITGGEGHLAGAIRRELAAAGYTVLAPGRKQLDVTCDDAVAAFFRQAPRVDLLINNAGVAADALAARMTAENWRQVLDVNLSGVFRCTHAALRSLLKSSHGHVVNIGSYSGLVGNAGQANYAAAKAGMLGLTRSLAQEYGKRGLRVNCVLPGYLKTKMTAGVSPQAEARALDQHTLKRFNTPDQAARFIVVLDSLLHISGQHFQLDSRVSPWA